MVATENGLMSSDGTVIQPQGFGKAYPINNLLPGHEILMPVPNQAGVLVVQSDPSYLGVDLSLYKEFYPHLHFNLRSQTFDISDLPDATFRFGLGRAMNFNIETLAISNNGRYIVVDVPHQSFMRIDLDTLAITPFATTLPIANNAGLLPAYTAIDDSGQYAAIAYNAPGYWGGVSKYFKVVDVNSCTGHIPSTAYDTPAFACNTVDEEGFLEQQVSGLSGFGGVAFEDQGNLLTDIFTGTDTVAKRYSLVAPGGQYRLEDYLAVGDSYISGEGAFAYVNGTDTATNECHQSVLSYPYLIGASNFSSFASVACSGAVINNIIGDRDQVHVFQTKPKTAIPTQQQQELAELDHIPGVVLQNAFVQQDNPQVITLSVGGNDIGFSDIIKQCILPFDDLHSTAQNCYQTYEDRLELINSKILPQFNRLYSTYKAMLGNDPTRRVYVIGYPQIVSPDGSCGDNVRLSSSDRLFASQIISYLDSVIQQAAAKAGVYYVGTQHTLDGHRLCESGTPAVNGLTAGKDNLGVLGNESYHPTPMGYELLENAILSQTAGLTAAMPAADVSEPNPSANDTLDILQAPKENTTIYNVLSLGEDVLDVARLDPLAPANFDINQYEDSLAPDSDFTAVLHSNPVMLGTFQTDGDGELKGTITIPTGVTPGFHTLHFYGKDLAGNPVDLQKVVYVDASVNDYDGDSIPNSTDSCPTIPNSGHDVDQDGIDDACDPVIGPAPAPVAPNPPAGGQTGTNGNDTVGTNDTTDTTTTSGRQSQSSVVIAHAPGSITTPPTIDMLASMFGGTAASQVSTGSTAAPSEVLGLTTHAKAAKTPATTKSESGKPYIVVAIIAAALIAAFWRWRRVRRSANA